ncbi:MAG: M20/M25/M40 family metallo-hydrolase [Kiritimatiellae bacterium]|nr:M20/M25/M40 family metallo-hydrolase [Kiritimatiellia bacterium]
MEKAVRDKYFEFLRFESVSSDPAKLRESVAAAQWLKARAEEMGFSVRLETEDFAPPVVLAERKGESPVTVLVYGHYDVQPADPLSEWDTPPFEPTVKDGRVYCRGAQDDKGQLFALLTGIGDYLDKMSVSGGETPTIKLCLEGQEESGSPALIKMAPRLRRELAADVLLVCDTAAAADLRPAIVAGLRGVAHFTVRLEGANRDLHSGEYGGVAPNAAQAIAELVASLHDKHGEIAVAGFMDGIEPPTAAERAAAAESTPSTAAMEADIGTSVATGNMVDALSFKPTIEVNGIHSGYGGPGAKTIIPAWGEAKISMRFVPGQSPKAAFAAVKAHLEANCPKGMRLSIPERSEGAGGFRLPLSSPVFNLAAEVLKGMDGRGAVFQWDGASIPVVSVLKETSGAAPLIVGWGQAGDRIHSPNESYGFNQFEKAREWARRILENV